jgi:hypothetical protein
VVLPSGGAGVQVGELLEKHFVEAALETFIPTEKLPADSAISFPVDI